MKQHVETSTAWNPTFSRWRHGGWYVHQVRHIGGACGCVSNNYPDKKWRIVCDRRRKGLGEEGDFTFPTRDAAARAEYELAQARIADELKKWTEIPNDGGYRQAIGEYAVQIIRDFEGDYCVRVEHAGLKSKFWASQRVASSRRLIGLWTKFWNYRNLMEYIQVARAIEEGRHGTF